MKMFPASHRFEEHPLTVLVFISAFKRF